MNELAKHQEILERLRPALEQEGLEVEAQGVEGETLNIRARRTGPGVPVAFMVKAISGTFRRYLPEIQDVCLTEYDPGPEGAPKTRSSPDFEKVLRHRAPSVPVQPRGIPAVDLSGLDRRQAIRALEAFVRVWSAQSGKVRFHGLTEDAPQRAAEKWASVYREDYHSLVKDSEDVWTVYFGEVGVNGSKIEAEEVMPGRVFLIDE